jgi:uncharacterized tellurite resistance protein B-like protein
MTVSGLSRDAKVFLAGALRRMILADGVIVDAEIAWVDRLRDEDRFDSLDACLDEFAGRVTDDEQFWAFAAEITDPETRTLILGHLEGIAEYDGSLHQAEDRLLRRLRQIWSVAK